MKRSKTTTTTKTKSKKGIALCGALVGALALSLGLGGCSGGGGAAVKGTVTMDGQPLGHADVTFLPEKDAATKPGVATVTRTDDNGHFEIKTGKKMKPGKYYVQVSKWVDKTTGQVPEADPEAGQDAEQRKLAGLLKNVVPERYSSNDNLAALPTVEIKSDGSDNLTIEVKAK
jgi:hypothetical protein